MDLRILVKHSIIWHQMANHLGSIWYSRPSAPQITVAKWARLTPMSRLFLDPIGGSPSARIPKVPVSEWKPFLVPRSKKVMRLFLCWNNMTLALFYVILIRHSRTAWLTLTLIIWTLLLIRNLNLLSTDRRLEATAILTYTLPETLKSSR